jgi:hypothetical protein
MGKILERRRKPPQVERAPLDTWLSRTANASQALLLALGVFGYFYTVLPLYQKALLDEDIAQKSLELRAKERELADLAYQVKSKSDEVRRASEQLQATARKAAAAEKALIGSELAAVKAATAASSADAARRDSESKFRTASAEAEARYLELSKQIVTTESGTLAYCVFNVVVSDKRLDGSEFRKCASPHFDAPSKSLKQLRPEDTTRYSASGKRLLDELEPQFFEYARQVNSRAEEVERERNAPRPRGVDKDYDRILNLVSEDSKKRNEGYRVILDQLIRKLRSEVLHD